MADDIGAGELACYGHPYHKTPHLDALAAEGVRFKTCYASPLCHPTRLMLMTGQYGCHNGVLNFAGRRGGPDPQGPAEDITTHHTFGNMLQAHGYATGLAGKWQLSGKLPTLIHEAGFDEYCVWAYKHYLPEGVEHTGRWEKKNTKPARYWHPCVMKNGKYVPTQEDDYGPDIYMDFALDFTKRNKDKPFFLYCPLCLTHAPYEPSPHFKQRKKPSDLKISAKQHAFMDNVQYLDTLVGRLVEGLKAQGQWENTILFFTGDNGTGGNGKAQPTELGARVPMIVAGPGLVKQREASDELVDLSDIFPTVAELSGAPLPEDRPIDGRSYAPFLAGASEKTRDWIFSFLADRRILRTKRWLLEDNSPLHYGRLYDCGDCRDGASYKEVTNSDAPEVKAIKAHFNTLLEKLPAPVLPEDGPAGK